MFVPDTITPEMIQEEKISAELEILKKTKYKQIESIEVTINGVTFDGDSKAQHNMSATGTLANWLFNKAIADVLRAQAANPVTDDITRAMLNGLADMFDAIYQQVYKDQKVGWRGADNKMHLVQAESVLEALMASMQAVGSVIETADEQEQQLLGGL